MRVTTKKKHKIGNNDWSGQFTGKDGVYSVEDFLNNKQAQENAQKAFKQAQWKYLQNNGSTKYLGQTINGIKITPAALLGGAHIGGQGKVLDFVRSGGKIDGEDDNGIPVSEYMRRFQDYDVSGITGLKNDKSVQPQQPSKSNIDATTISNPTLNNQDFNNLQRDNISGNLNYNSQYENRLFKLGLEYNDNQQNKLPNLDDLMINPFDQQQSNNPWDIIPMAIPEDLKSSSELSTNFTTPIDTNQFAQQLGLESLNMDIPQDKLKQSGSSNPITSNNHIFTPEEIGNMTNDEFERNLPIIEQQLKDGLIKHQSEQSKDYSGYKNPETGTDKIYTREDISKMSTKEYSENEKEILAQMNNIGIPYKNDLPSNVKTHEKSYSTSSENANGKWVTINGNHVLIKD